MNAKLLKDDQWLAFWQDKIVTHANQAPVLELGCGTGRDSTVLTQFGLDVVALDISMSSLLACTSIPLCLPLRANLSSPLPFQDHRFGVVVASLSLHYFLWRDTARIISEIKRVLVPGGMLLLRVNATDDYLFGAGVGDEIEENFYRSDPLTGVKVHASTKRFFHRAAVEKLLGDMALQELRHRTIDRYGKAKQIWEAYAIV